MAVRLAAMAALVGAASAIYPDDHWNYATKLTEDNFDSTVQEAIDSGKTLFVPVKKFAGNPDVMFGDSALSDNGARGGPGANPGAGGWPTVRYYNKETGAEGKPYEKKTDMAMCDELGPKGDTYLDEFIMEKANTSLCKATEPFTGCSDKEKKYIEKISEKSAEEQAAQQTRLLSMKGKKMTQANKEWLNQRLAILKQLVASDKAEL